MSFSFFFSFLSSLEIELDFTFDALPVLVDYGRTPSSSSKSIWTIAEEEEEEEEEASPRSN